MPFINVEIKARCSDVNRIRNYLHQHHAEFKGMDHQTDTYFNVSTGRLKLREGNIENNLIFYQRANYAGIKDSHFRLLKVAEPIALKEMLEQSIGIKVIIKKKREIYYIRNVKFHIDEVPGLGNFIEIEAGNVLADLNREQLQQQCDHYCKELSIQQEDMLAESYSDMLLRKENITE